MADRGGVEALSMRRLAKRLGVEAMSLYKHVANKDEVLDGIVDLVVAEISLAPAGTAWRPAMRERARSARSAFRRHPWAAPLLESRVAGSPVRLAYADGVVGALLRDGFTPTSAYRAFLILDSYIYGFTLQELNWPFGTTDRAKVVAALRRAIPAQEFPHLAAVMTAFGAQSAGYDREFELGLELILDGVASLRG
jgi:AcrR family transcriptional regulator